MEHETETALDKVEQNLDTIHSDDATEVAVARAMEQSAEGTARSSTVGGRRPTKLKHNAEAAFDAYRNERGWEEQL
jgi:hypothetical protein